jgi:hypothetical protein
MLPFNHDPHLKQRFLLRVGAHPELFARFIDERPRDIYRRKLRIESVALALNRSVGLPIDLSHLMHVILQNLPSRHVNIFRDQLIAAINPGADLSLTTAQFIHWLLTDLDGVRRNLAADDLYYLDYDAEIYARYLSGKTATHEEWETAVNGADLAIWWAEEERTSTELYHFARYAAEARHSAYATAQTAILAAHLKSPEYWGVMNYKLSELLSSARPG